MNVTIFGATSSIGLELIHQALTKNYTVTAFDRNIATLIDKDLHLDTFTAVKGYVFDEDDIEKAIEHCDVVISCLGGGLDGLDRTRSLGTKNIIAQMQKAKIKRIIALGNESILNLTVDTLIMDEEEYPEELKPIAAEHLNVLYQLENSTLDWTLICPNKILNAEVNYNYTTNISYLPEQNIGVISTGNTADFMLHCINNQEYVKQKIGISNNK